MNHRIRIGAFSPSVLLDVATRTGELAKAGLHVEQISGASSSEQFAALLRGDLDAVLTSPDNVVGYRCVPDNPLGRTADVRILAAIDQGLGLSLFAKPGVSSPEDLLGGTLAVDVPVSGYAFTAYELLARLGLSAGSDIKVQALGPTPKRAAALIAGDCTATVLNAGSDLRVEDQGCRRLARATALGPYLGSVLASRGPAIEEDSGPLRTLTRLMVRMCAQLTNGELQQQTLQAAEDRLELPVRAARRYVDTLIDPHEGLIADGHLRPAALDTLLTLRNQHGSGSPPLDRRSVLDSGLIDDRFPLLSHARPPERRPRRSRTAAAATLTHSLMQDLDRRA